MQRISLHRALGLGAAIATIALGGAYVVGSSVADADPAFAPVEEHAPAAP